MCRLGRMNNSLARPAGADVLGFTRLMLQESRQYGVVLLDQEGFITGWNHGAVFITGFTPVDVIGRPMSALFTEEDRAFKLDLLELETAARAGAADDERWHQRKDGSRFWAAGTCARVGAAGSSQGFVKVFKDGTHLKARMTSLENRLRQSETQIAEYGRMLGKVAHEFRNGMAPLFNVRQIMQRLPEVAEPHGKLLGVMERQLSHMARIVEDVLDITRAGAGKLTLRPQAVILQSLLDGALEAMLPTAQHAGVSLQSVQSIVPLTVEVDPVRLQQVIGNLISNAIKFTPSGGEVWLTATVDHSHFLITVRDSGRGIGPDLLPLIFSAFTQASEAETHRGSGLGLGLAVVKEIVDLHHGTVEVRSEGEGKGSEFVVRIPLRPGQAPLGL